MLECETILVISDFWADPVTITSLIKASIPRLC